MKTTRRLRHISFSLSFITIVCISPSFAGEVKTPAAIPVITPGDPTGRKDIKNINDTVTVKQRKQADAKTDSTAVVLPETTVEANYYLHTAKKSVYIPGKRDKNVSFDAMDLIKRMNIPQLLATPSGSVTASNGEKITYFINGMPAADFDLRGMNINDVMKVEYLDYPEEANFQGAPHVVNFIMKVYEYGGYTKADFFQSYINGFTLSENIFSKLAYKRMTYDFVLNSSIHGNNSTGSDKEEIFRFPTGTVTKHHRTLNGKERDNVIPVKFRALYSHGSTFISNTIAFQYSDVFRSHSNGVIEYDNFQAPEYTFMSNNPYKANTVTWNGYAGFNPGKGWNIFTSGDINYTHYNIRNSYVSSIPGSTEGNPVSDIKNYMNEDSFQVGVALSANKRFSGKHSLNMMAKWGFTNDKIHYLKKDNNKSNLESNNLYIRGTYNLTLSKLNLTLEASMSYENSDINGYNVNKLSPGGIVNLRYVFNTKNNISFVTMYSMIPPGLSSKNTELIQRNEIMYTVGNPDLKPYHSLFMSLNYLFQPSNNFYISPGLNWHRDHNAPHSIYVPMEGKQAMLQTYENSGHTDNVAMYMNCSLYLLNRNLILSLTPEYRIQHTTYPQYPTLHPWYVYASATGYLGNFYISGNYYSGKSPRYNGNMTSMSELPHQYWLTLGWGNGKVTANMNIYNIFNKEDDNTRTFIHTPYYSSTSISRLGNRQRITINLSYTFGYGKKINRGDELSKDVSTAASGVNL